MKVQVYSRKHMKEIEQDVDTCLISIWGKIALATQNYSEDDVPMDNWRDVLKLEFDDAVDPVLNMDLTLFDEEMAKKTVAFIEKYKGLNFVVHCDAGISRSVAVATFMKDVYEYDRELFEISSDQFRNIHVMNLLRRAWYEQEYGNE